MAVSSKKRAARLGAERDNHLIPGLILGGALLALLILAGFLLPGGNDRQALDTGVVINEIMSANVAVCAPVNGQYYDWMEIANRSTASVDITGWKLADNVDLRRAYVFPQTVLQPGQCLLVYAAGKTGVSGSGFAPFGVSADGETLLLLTEDGKTADSVRFPPLNVGETYARNPETGEWAVSEEYTPGAANTHASYASAVEPGMVGGSVVINELTARNASGPKDADGELSDWIELYNQSASPVNLKGWTITDDVRSRRKWTFPDAQLAPGQYLLLYASGKNRTAGELHTNFALEKGGESVYLFNANGALMSRASYDALESGQSLSRQKDGVYTTSLPASPGFENTAAGARLARGTEYKTLVDNGLGLYINEVLVTGTGGNDWVELSNRSGQAIDLSGFGLSDDAGKPLRWTFPAGSSIGPGQFLLVHMGGSGSGGYRANFALSEGDTLLLSTPGGALVDRMALYDQINAVSYGRADGHSQYRYFSNPTPGGVNSGTSYEKQAQTVEFSVPGGAVNAEVVVVSLSAEAGMNIFYTTDGSEPTVNSAVYSEPLALTRTTVVRAVAWKQDCLPSPSAASTYLFGASHSVRIVAISGPAGQLTGESGVLMTGDKTQEVKVHVEMYEPDGSKLLSQDCGLEISGMYSRVQFDQKSFKLTARGEYGDNRFRGSLFSKRPYTEYKSVVLRAAGQDNMQTRMRDSILTALSADLGLMYQETEVTVVYVNGQYWGHYNLRERINEQSLAQFEGWDDPEHIDFLEGSSYTVRQGSNSNYKTVVNTIKKYGLESDEYVAALSKYVDIKNYLDYVALEMYTCNQDMNNLRLYRNSHQDGRWRWIIYDLDLSYQVDQNSVSRWLTSGGVGTVTSQDNTLFIALMSNEKTRDYFLTRMGQLLATTFSTANVMSKIQDRYIVLQPEMEKHCERWGWSYSQWQRYGTNMVNYARQRPKKLIEYFQQTLGLTNAQVEHYFGDALQKINEQQ